MKSGASLASIVTWALLSASLPGLARAATLAHRYEFNGNVRDSVGELNGTATTALVNDQFVLEAPLFVDEMPENSTGPTKSIELGANAGTRKSGFHIAGDALDRTAGSISVWLKPAAPPAGDTAIDYVIYIPKIGDGMFVAINPNAHAELAARFGAEAGTAMAPGSVAEGKWLHLVVTWNAESGIQVYIDGALKGSAPLAGFTSTASVRLGNFEFSGADFLDSQYTGLLYDLQFYRGTLNAENVTYLYNHPGEAAPGSGDNS